MKLLILLFLLAVNCPQQVYKNKLVYGNERKEDVTIFDAKYISLRGDTILSITEDRYKNGSQRFMPFAFVNGKMLSIKERYWINGDLDLSTPELAIQAFEICNNYDEKLLSEEDKNHVNCRFIFYHAARLREKQSSQSKNKK